MLRFMMLCLVLFYLLAPPAAFSNTALVGSWQYKDVQLNIVTEFLTDGTFRQVTVGPQGRQTFSGRYQLSSQSLYLQADGGQPAVQAVCRFADPDTAVVTYASGETLTWKRVSAQKPSPAPTNPSESPAAPASTTPASGGASTKNMKTLMMQRTWEPREQAFSFLLPRGWTMEGGVFNVNPLQMNGPGNTTTPKCDLTVKADARGTAMLRWAPSWNYADLSLAPAGWGLFRPGMHYQGMPVRPIVNARQFLTELLKSMRPQATDIKIVAEDPMPEVAGAYARQAEPINQNLRKMGLAPTRFEALALVVEYREAGEHFREVLSTTIADARSGAFMWSNDDTITFRTPVSRFEDWKPALDTLRASRQPNPQWVAAVTKASGERAKAALETQRYIANVASQIVENRRRTHAEIRHEQWLFISGQEEYTNPFNGQTERDTSYYGYRWVNNQGDTIYTDENSFDPNTIEEYKTREWKRTPIRRR
jgi:hypothetical protein